MWPSKGARTSRRWNARTVVCPSNWDSAQRSAQGRLHLSQSWKSRGLLRWLRGNGFSGTTISAYLVLSSAEAEVNVYQQQTEQLMAVRLKLHGFRLRFYGRYRASRAAQKTLLIGWGASSCLAGEHDRIDCFSRHETWLLGAHFFLLQRHIL